MAVVAPVFPAILPGGAIVRWPDVTTNLQVPGRRAGDTVAGSCSYSADATDYEEWGGDPDDWPDRLDELGIEGETWECPHEALDWKEYCHFHTDPDDLPESADESEAVLRAIEASTGDDPTARRRREFIGGTFGKITLGAGEIMDSGHFPIRFLGATFQEGFQVDGESPIHVDTRVATVCGCVDFRGATIEGMADFRGATIKGRTNFWGAIIRRVYFNEARIEGGVAFRGATIEAKAGFWGATIEGEAGFRGTTIEGEADFQRTTMEGGASFWNARIKDEAKFRGATIKGEATFAEVTIEGEATFPEMKIEGEADFREATIKEEAGFRGATIEGEANFGEVTIAGKAGFWGATIEGEAGFRGATIEEGASFRKARIDGGAVFRRATIEEGANFRKVRIKDEANFGEARVNGGTVFRRARIDGKADFGKARIDGGAVFRGATIGGEADFRQTTIHGTADFDSSEDYTTTFNGPASFAGMRIDGPTDFSGTMIDEEVHRTEFDPNEPLNFSGAELTGAEFAHADVTGADFTDADLTDADFTDAVLQWASFEQAKLSRGTLFNADLRGASLSGALLGDIRINEDTYFLGLPEDGDPSNYTLAAAFTTPCCVYESDFEAPHLPLRAIRWPRQAVRRVRARLSSVGTDEDSDDGPPEGVDPPESNLDKAKSTYRALEELARENARPHLQAQAFVRRQEVQRQQYGEVTGSDGRSLEERTIAGLRWIRASLARLIILYGESPWRVIGWALTVITTFALIYPIGEWVVPIKSGAVKGDPVTWERILSAGFPDGLILLGQSFYYSTLTFTTLGFGDYRPQGFGQTLTTIETALGAVMIALLVFVLGRKATR